MTIVLSIHKANEIAPSLPVDNLVISIKETIPEFSTLNELDAQCHMEAKWLEGALVDALPGALYDQLVLAMLKRKATHFRVAHNDYSVQLGSFNPEESDQIAKRLEAICQKG